MLVASHTAKVELTAPASLKSTKPKKSQRKQQSSQQRATAALLSSGLNFTKNHNHRQQHNDKGDHEKQQQQQQNYQNRQTADTAVNQLNQDQQQPQEVNNNSSINSEQQQQQQQQDQDQRTMEAMKKLDASLLAYLTGEQLNAGPTCGQEMEPPLLTLKKMEQLCSSNSSSSVASACSLTEQATAQQIEANNNKIGIVSFINDPQDTLYDMFCRMSGIKLHLEALTLQPEGTKRMELQQNDIRPIFTVECQLSHELIKSVPRYDMYHIMQFESEKFQSLTQCTRFGQEAVRAVKLESNNENDLINNNVNVNGRIDAQPNFGRIHFTVWWREPGTCLNEMLGMGVLALEELYTASVLEQCKRIVIQRRKEHLANLYLKVSVQVDANRQRQQKSLLMAHAAGADAADVVVNNVGNNGAPTVTESTVGASNKKISMNSNSNEKNEKGGQIETINFMAETSRVRLLRGLVYAGEVRCMDLNPNNDYLICRRFWEDELAITMAIAQNSFNYHEQFAVINDESFLRRVDRQHLQLELWRRQPSSTADGNGNSASDIKPCGIVRLPLHQFFIAYRDVAITNHLCKARLPVISFDAWAPIMSCAETNTRIGELRCLLAIGSDEQVASLREKSIHAGLLAIESDKKTSELTVPASVFHQILAEPISSIKSTNNVAASNAELMGLLRCSINARHLSAEPAMARNITAASTAVPTTRTSTSTLLKPLQASNVKLFRFLLEVQRATDLPRNPATRGKKKRNSNAGVGKLQRFPPNEAPNSYVTFQADEGEGPIYKSHEGAVYATAIIEKSTQPEWHECFRISVSTEYLLNPQKRFILKIWKKAAATDLPNKRQQPKPMEDAIIGFAALDLGLFLRGLFIAGSFNIVDFNGRINGQLELRAQPLEDLHKLIGVSPGRGSFVSNQSSSATITSPDAIGNDASSSSSLNTATGMDNFIDEFEHTLDLAHLNLGQAIKRKYSELESISQRLRSRLTGVTGEQISPQFNPTLLDGWQACRDESTADDDDLDEFERDINTSPAAQETSLESATNVDDVAKE